MKTNTLRLMWVTLFMVGLGAGTAHAANNPMPCPLPPAAHSLR
jgi:hypothetical protein